MNYEFISVERDGPITTVQINRPEVLNALHYAANIELHNFFDDFNADPEQWVAIITGAGDRAFCAGNDLKAQHAAGKLEAPVTGMGGLTSRFDMYKPLIAAVNGLAFGGGFEIVLACDIVVAAPEAAFSLPEPRVGLAALGGGLHRLPAAVGLHRAMWLVLTSARITADQATVLGIVSEVVPRADLPKRAKEIAAAICEAGPMAIRASKENVLRSVGLNFEEAMNQQPSLPNTVAMWHSDDAKEGPRAFSEKRKPQWRGR